MKLYRLHRCSRRHRTSTAFANCAWPHAAWIRGDGPIALVTWCGVACISLHLDVATAEHALGIVNGTGCGGRCTGRHELVRLDLGATS